MLILLIVVSREQVCAFHPFVHGVMHHQMSPMQGLNSLYMGNNGGDDVPVLDKWITLPNVCISGTVYNSMDPDIQDGDTISTSPLKHPEMATESTMVETWSGKEYLLLKSAVVVMDHSSLSSSTATSVSGSGEVKELLQRVKDAGTSGAISYALWELGFWTISVPVCIFAYRQVFGHWPDWSSQEDSEKIGTEALVFVNVARFVVPVRIGLALSTVTSFDRLGFIQSLEVVLVSRHAMPMLQSKTME